ncbi:hypothetical protein CXG81DRAFT_23207 [Caulochytrium protostelioides]|uniref:Metaxin glutathione S-transferase domain-containing protein n=1 Tax=Caulochytrium protostelioides TaxID=1555241 RepID=A0A4P9XF99_9FUNG|nr:hypothetical protein CXG81DRAFT_23207 [Caulochytrium protostelioides]|eukprot:RKP04255.1 hypothetical protein CXG81DRAFT_23207 [Caulochytrium protostelioides]
MTWTLPGWQAVPALPTWTLPDRPHPARAYDGLATPPSGCLRDAAARGAAPSGIAGTLWVAPYARDRQHPSLSLDWASLAAQTLSRLVHAAAPPPPPPRAAAAVDPTAFDERICLDVDATPDGVWPFVSMSRAAADPAADGVPRLIPAIEIEAHLCAPLAAAAPEAAGRTAAAKDGIPVVPEDDKAAMAWRSALLSRVVFALNYYLAYDDAVFDRLVGAGYRALCSSALARLHARHRRSALRAALWARRPVIIEDAVLRDAGDMLTALAKRLERTPFLGHADAAGPVDALCFAVLFVLLRGLPDAHPLRAHAERHPVLERYVERMLAHIALL